MRALLVQVASAIDRLAIPAVKGGPWQDAVFHGTMFGELYKVSVLFLTMPDTARIDDPHHFGWDFHQVNRNDREKAVRVFPSRAGTHCASL